MKDWNKIEKERNEVYNQIRSFFDKRLNLKTYVLSVNQYRKTISDRQLLSYFDRIAKRFYNYTEEREWRIKVGLGDRREKRIHFKLTAEDKQKRKEVAEKNAERASVLHAKHKNGPSEWVTILYTPMGNTRKK